MGAMVGAAISIDPLVGGGFTSNVTWRWCFDVDLPFGLVSMVSISLFSDIPNRNTTKASWNRRLLQLGPLSTFLSLFCLC